MFVLFVALFTPFILRYAMGVTIHSLRSLGTTQGTAGTAGTAGTQGSRSESAKGCFFDFFPAVLKCFEGDSSGQLLDNQRASIGLLTALER